MDKAELVITALQQRIGELTSNYETQIALLRAEITLFMKEKEDQQAAKNQYAAELADKVSAN
jgi:hypothetical protein